MGPGIYVLAVFPVILGQAQGWERSSGICSWLYVSLGGTLLLWALVSTCVDEGGVQQSGAAILHRVPWHTAHLSQHCSPVCLDRPRTSLSTPPMSAGSVVLWGGWGWP